MIKYSYKNKAHIKDRNSYDSQYQNSIKNNDEFWANEAKRISWIKKWDNVSHVNYKEADIKWFEGAKLNVSYNCIDRHVEDGKGNNIAIIWEGNNPDESITFTYSQLLDKVCAFSNVL